MFMSTTMKIALVIMVRVLQKMKVWFKNNKGAEIFLKYFMDAPRYIWKIGGEERERTYTISKQNMH